MPRDRAQGLGQPSIFNTDLVVEERKCACRGTSGCVETGAFGTEAYILTGYFNLPKVLELTLNNGYDPRTGKRDCERMRDEQPATFKGVPHGPAGPPNRMRVSGTHVSELSRDRKGADVPGTTAIRSLTVAARSLAWVTFNGAVAAVAALLYLRCSSGHDRLPLQ